MEEPKVYILTEPNSGKEYTIKEYDDHFEVIKTDQPRAWIFKHKIEIATPRGPVVMQQNKAVDFRKAVRSYIKKELKHGKGKDV